MTRGILSLLIIAALTCPLAANAQQRPGACQGMGQQTRMHSPRIGAMGGDQIHQRDRLRDGTGANCPGCASTSIMTGQTQSNTRTQKQPQAQTQNSGRTRNEIQSQIGTQGETQNQVRTEQQQQTQGNFPE